MQLIGATPDMMNSFAQMALGQSSAAAKTPSDSGLSLFNPPGLTYWGIDANSLWLNATRGIPTASASPAIDLSVLGLNTPAAAQAPTLDTSSGGINQMIEQLAKGFNFNSVVDTAQINVLTNTSTLPGLDHSVKTNTNISQWISNSSKTPNDALDALLKELPGVSSDIVPGPDPNLSVAQYAQDKAATSNLLAPATVGTSYDLNYLHALGDNMASKSFSKRLVSFGIDESLHAVLKNLPGVNW